MELPSGVTWMSIGSISFLVDRSDPDGRPPPVHDWSVRMKRGKWWVMFHPGMEHRWADEDIICGPFDTSPEAREQYLLYARLLGVPMVHRRSL